MASVEEIMALRRRGSVVKIEAKSYADTRMPKGNLAALPLLFIALLVVGFGILSTDTRWAWSNKLRFQYHKTVQGLGF